MSFINRILKEKGKEHKEEVAQQNYSFKNQAKEIQEQEKQFYKDFENKKKLLEKNKNNKRVPMKTKIVDNSKAISRKNALNKLIEFEPKLREKTSKFIDNIVKGIEEKIPKKPKKRLMSTTKIVEYKPKVHELDKVVELLGELNQTKEIINAIKYVKNFIKKELSNK